MDFLSELSQRNMLDTIDSICVNLRKSDIRAMANVCKNWKNILIEVKQIDPEPLAEAKTLLSKKIDQWKSKARSSAEDMLQVYDGIDLSDCEDLCMSHDRLYTWARYGTRLKIYDVYWKKNQMGRVSPVSGDQGSWMSMLAQRKKNSVFRLSQLTRPMLTTKAH